MKELPILFSPPMVRALLDGSKTQTRRVVKWQGPKKHPHDFNLAFIDNPAGVKRLCVPYEHPNDGTPSIDSPAHRHYCPYGDPGDRLWVRETHTRTVDGEPILVGYEESDHSRDKRGPGFDKRSIEGLGEVCFFDLSLGGWGGRVSKKYPSIHMPRWASRIDLEITGVRVERLQECSEADAKAEGAEPYDVAGLTAAELALLDAPLMDPVTPYKNGYALLWESLAGPGSWDANPWVWVIAFKVIKPQ
jgi:hypothetical protein